VELLSITFRQTHGKKKNLNPIENTYGGCLMLSALSGQIQQAVTSFLLCLFIRHIFFLQAAASFILSDFSLNIFSLGTSKQTPAMYLVGVKS